MTQLNIEQKVKEAIRADDVRELATNPATPPEILREIFENHSSTQWGWTEMDLAENPATPQDVLYKLSKSKTKAVQGEVARNPSTPEEVLLALARKSLTLRTEVASNVNAPKNLLKKLSRRATGDMLEALLSNPSSPEIVFELFVKKRERKLHKFLLTYLNYSPRKWSPMLSHLRPPRKPERSLKLEFKDTLRELLPSRVRNDWFLTEALAKNPAAPASALAKIAFSSLRQVKYEIASNLNTPAETLLKLAQEGDEELTKIAFENPTLFNHLKERAIEEGVISRDYEAPLDWYQAMYL